MMMILHDVFALENASSLVSMSLFALGLKSRAEPVHC